MTLQRFVLTEAITAIQEKVNVLPHKQQRIDGTNQQISNLNQKHENNSTTYPGYSSIINGIINDFKQWKKYQVK